MDTTQKTTLLAHFNALAQDEESPLGTSDFAPWTFSDLKFRAGKYTLSFKNEAGTDKVEIPFADSPVDGAVAPAFETAALAALRRWEAIESGEDGDEDEDEDEDGDDDE